MYFFFAYLASNSYFYRRMDNLGKTKKNKGYETKQIDLRTICLSLLLSVYAFFSFGIAKTFAQDNNSGMDAEFYNYYKYVFNTDLLEGAKGRIDSLISLGKKKNDRRALSIALAYRIRWNIKTKDTKSLKKYIKESRNYAISRNKQLNYFYNLSLDATEYLLDKKYVMALYAADKLQQEAITSNNTYGLMISYRTKAYIYHDINNFTESIEACLDAIRIAKERNFKESKYAEDYITLCNCYLEKGKYAEAIKTAKSVLAFSYYPRAIRNSYLIIGISAFYDKNYKLMDSCWNKVRTIKDASGSEKEKEVHLESVYMLHHKRYNEFLSTVGKKAQEGSFIKNELLSMYYDSIGSYKKSYEYARKSFSSRLKTLEKTSDFLLNEFNELTGTYKAQKEKDKLLLSSKELELKNSKSKISIIKQERELMKMESARQQKILQNNELRLASRQLELEQAEIWRNIQKTQQKSLHHKYEYEKTRNKYIAVGGSLVLALTAIILFLSMRERHSNKLIEEESKLLEATNKSIKEDQKKAESAGNIKTFFIQNMSHEIRTPLNAIVGFSSMIADAKDEEYSQQELTEFSDMIEKNSDLLTTLVNDILDLSYLESGSYKMVYNKTYAATIATAAIDSVRHRVKSNTTLLLEKPEAEQEIPLYTDPQSVQQVLINFLTNAIKYTDSGSISLCYSYIKGNANSNNESVVFIVTDTGCGIDKEEAEKVFRRYEKLGSIKQGCGLGLNISRVIAENLGGRIWLDTEYTDGARFCFEVPLNSGHDE